MSVSVALTSYLLLFCRKRIGIILTEENKGITLSIKSILKIQRVIKLFKRNRH